MQDPADCVRQLAAGAEELRLAYREVRLAAAANALEEELSAGWTDPRKAEFRTGRACARELLASLGAAPSPIGFDAEGAPCWPASFVGSISHKRGFCLVGVASRSSVRGVGLDLERDSHDTAFAADIASSEELAALRSVRVGSHEQSASLLLSAKEAAYKCQYVLTGTVLAWLDVVVTFSPGVFVARVPGVEPIRGLYAVAGGWIATAAIAKAQ